MGQKLRSLLNYLGSRQVRLTKAAVLCLFSLGILTFFTESSGLNQHLRLAPESALPQGKIIQGLIWVLGPFLGLDPVEDQLKLILLLLLCGAFLFTLSLLFISVFAFLFGFSFVGNQLGQIGTNYHLQREVLYRGPFRENAGLLRRGTPDEKMEFLRNKLQSLCDSKQVSLDDLNLSLEIFKESLASLETKESLESTITQHFEQCYALYLGQQPSSKPFSGGTNFGSTIPEFLSEHYLLTTVVVVAAIFVLYALVTRSPPPADPGPLGPPPADPGPLGPPPADYGPLTYEDSKMVADIKDLQSSVMDVDKRLREDEELILKQLEELERYDKRISQNDYNLQEAALLLKKQEAVIDQKLLPAVQEHNQWFTYVHQDVRALFRLMEAVAVAHPEGFEGLEVKQDPRSGNPPKL